MAFWNWRRNAEKRVSPSTPGAKDISPLIQALTNAMDMQARPDPNVLARPQEWGSAIFGPNWPLAPEPLDQPSPSGWTDPRQYQYPVAWNIPGTRNDFVVPWDTLKQSAETPLFRSCIEIRKNEIATLDWAVRPSPKFIDRESKQTGQAKNEIEKGIRAKYGDEIRRGMEFWQTPDRHNGRDFSQWVSLLLEEYLTWDAMAIYPRKTYGGKLLDLWIIDGSTVKPLLDERGGRPVPPYPAYQQILYGYPRGEFTADTVDIDGNLVVPGGLTASQLIYERRVHRTWTPYGFSPTEQALLDGLLWNKRFQWIMSEYTEGSQPVSYLVNKGVSDWTPKQQLEYEKALNDRLSGKTSERFRNTLLPPGIEPSEGSPIPERYRPDYDLFILKLVCAHFDVTIAELGFTEPGGLGSAGYHEGQADIQYRKATLPTTRWLGSLFTRIGTSQLGLPPELEFGFLGLENEDEAAADQIADSRVKSGRMTLNEDRARQGLPPYAFKEANMPMLETQRGVVYLEGSSDLVPAGVLLEPASEHPDVQGPNLDSDNAPVKRPAMTQDADKGAAMMEVSKYMRWLKRAEPGCRPFRFEHLTAELADELGMMFDHAEFASKAGGAGPKDGGSSHPHSQPGRGGRPTSSWSPYSASSS